MFLLVNPLNVYSTEIRIGFIILTVINIKKSYQLLEGLYWFFILFDVIC